MDNAQRLKRKPQTLNKAAKPAPEKPLARAADKQAPGYLQAKMKVSQPGDAHEQQADQVAERVSRAAKPAGSPAKDSVQRATLQPGQDVGDPQQTLCRKPAAEDKNPESTLSRKPDEKLAKKADDKLNKKADKPNLQAKGDVPQIDQATEERIDNMRGKGEPLPEAVKVDLQQQLQADFSSVRIHNNGEAAALAAGINARAFTVGNDIFFGTGEYAPDSAEGRKLLAHELTHVVQQNGTIGLVQREVTDQAAGERFGEKKTGYIEFPNLAVPSELLSAYTSRAPFIHHKAYSRVRNDQTEVWRDGIAVQTTRDKLQAIAGRRLGAGTTPSRYLFEVPSAHDYPRASEGRGRGTEFLNGGSLDDCARQAAIPRWDKSGNPHASASSNRRAMGSYDVDHMLEQRFGARLPTGDFSLRDDVHVMANFFLLDGNINRNVKVRNLDQAIDSALDRFRQNNSDTYDGKAFSEWTNAQLKSRLSLKFISATAGDAIGASGNNVWSQTDIESGTHIDALQPDAGATARIFYRTPADLDAQVPANKRMILFGTRRQTIDPNRQNEYRDMLAPFRLTKIDNVENDDLLRFNIRLPEDSAHFAGKNIDEPLVIKSLEGSERVGLAPMARFPLLMGLHRLADGESSSVLEHKQASPISIDHWEIDPAQGLIVQGQILPSLPLLQDAGIDFELSGRDITFSKTFSINDIAAPPPLQVSECSLTVSAGTRGLAVEGQVDFAVEQLGSGYLRGRLGSDRHLGVEGAFNFNSEIFDPAQVTLGYVDNAFYGEGRIGIPGSKVPGIRSATIAASFNEQGFSASGEAELDIPGVERGSMNVSYSEQDGFAVGGSFGLSSDIPGIRSGQVSVELRQSAEGAYGISASGEAVPDIPGFDSRLAISYDNGALSIEGHAQFQRGMLAGEATVGATNRALDNAGQPTGEATETMIMYGSGSATLQIAPWLQGTVGIAFAPNGEVTVVGEIGLPSAVELLPRKQVERNLFSVGTSIPIVPGIVARIAGGADAVAGFGPGQLDQMNLRVEYNPSHEENTHISGGAHLNVPADAGVRLFVRAGIGLGIPGASATGGLEIGGQLGIAGAAEASVNFDWTPATGLEINAEGYIHAQPRFVFDISGYVEVEALWVTVYEQRWNFASFEYGSDLTFGVRFPIHYREGQPFDIALSDVQFETPNIDTDDILSGLIDRIA